MKNIIIGLSFAALGLLAGWLIFGGSSEKTHRRAQIAQETVYTCSMHPQIRQNEPGKCPLCAMDLTPLAQGDDSMEGENSVTMSAAAVALSNVELLQAQKSKPQKTLKLYGNIQPNELKRHSQTAHIGGRIEKLFVNFEGEQVKSGQILASIYSPELLVAQTEFLEILNQGHPLLIETAKKRLSLLKITDKQISELEESGKVHPYVNIFSDASGIVTAKRTEHGEYIDAGMVLFDITNLSSVWAIFDAYEADLPYLKVGDRISYTVNAVPDAVFNGRIEFISPIIDDMSRTAKVRLETSNKDLKLKPGMLATALIQNAKSASGEAVILPRTAVLWTGHRSVVYIAKRLESGALNFTLREILLGTNLGDYVSVLSGVSQGEFVVANGVFAIDASAQLAGKKSMMSLTSTQQGGSMNNMTKTAVALAVACSVAIGSEEHNANRQNGANQANVAVSKNSAISKTTLSVQGACVMCKARIEGAAKSVSGVKLAEWNLEKKLLTLELDSSQTSLDAVSKAVAAVGHDTEKDKASDEVYNALHECCKYRKS